MIVVPSIAFLLLSCSSTTQTKIGSLSGTINLVNDTGNSALDPVDFGGVTVAIYSPVVLDTTIVRLNRDYPNIGVQISQETEFDHRLQNPVKLSSTNADGSFTISKIPVGKYNIVFIKESWGVHYLYDIDISEGENLLNQQGSPLRNGALEMFPIQELTGFINDSFEFKTNHNYKVIGNVNFGSSVVIYPESYIWIESGKYMSFNALLTTPEISSGYARITSADGMNSTNMISSASIQRFYAIECNQFTSFSDNRLSSIITSFSSDGWKIKTSDLTIENMILRNNAIGVQCDQVSGISVRKCNLISSNNVDKGCLVITNSDNTEIENCIALYCSVAISQNYTQNSIINNCYFKNNSIIDIYNSYQTTCSINQCSFFNSVTAIKTTGTSNSLIQYCEINGQTGIYNHNELSAGSSVFTAMNNNFNCSIYAAFTKSTFGIETHLNATNNYWGTTNISQINELIWDRNDEDVNDPNYYRLLGIIDFLPFKTSRIQTTGIQ